MTRTRANRLAYATVLAVVVPLGFAMKVYTGPGAAWAADYAAGFFYVVFWVFLFLSAFPDSSPGIVTLWVLGITCALEGLQLWHPPFLEAVRSTFAGRALVGTTFAWWDFAYYGFAAVTAPILARLIRSRVA
jgi:hypothetical protein